MVADTHDRMIHNLVLLSSGWSELVARSRHSYPDGFSSPTDLVHAAAALGMPALGLCDRNGLQGAAELARAATNAGIHPVIGAELDLAGDDRLRLLATDASAYRNISRAIDAAQRAGEKRQARLDIFGDADNPDPNLQLAHHRNRIIEPSRQGPTGPPARVDPDELRGCVVLAGGRGSAITRALMAGESRVARRHLDRLREGFGRDSVGLLLTNHLRPADPWLVTETAALAGRGRVDLVASNLPVHASAGDNPRLANVEYRLKSEVELRELLSAHPQAFHNAAAIAARCAVALDPLPSPDYR